MHITADQALVSQVLAGNRQSYGELVTRYQQSVFNVCYRILGERRDAEDLTQETFIRAYQKLNTFHLDRDFGPWVRRIAANLCLNHLQAIKKSQNEIPLDEQVSSPRQHYDPEKSFFTKFDAQHIQAAILGLPPPYRIVIELRHYQDLSYNEIAETLDLPLSDVKSHLYRARKQLAEKLSETDE